MYQIIIYWNKKFTIRIYKFDNLNKKMYAIDDAILCLLIGHIICMLYNVV